MGGNFKLQVTYGVIYVIIHTEIELYWKREKVVLENENKNFIINKI
jgi:hypothetical protein